MTIKTDRLKEAIFTIANEAIIAHSREFEHNHGIVTLVDVVFSPDKAYADLMVFSAENSGELAKFLSPIAGKIHMKISRDLALRKTPRIRFRLAKNQAAKKDILATIAELDAQYGLSQND